MHAAYIGEAWPLVSLYVIMITCLTVHAITCDELQCLNSNPCQSVITNDNRPHARCVCGGKWAGRRCEHLIHVTPESVTSSHVTLKVGFAAASNKMASQDGSSALSLVSPEEGEDIELNYTLVFWRKNDTLPAFGYDDSFLSSATAGGVTCVLLHGKHSRSPTVEGLLPRTRYTLCVENGFVDSCYLSSFADPASSSFPSSSLSSRSKPSWPPNCVTIFTPSSQTKTVVITTSTTVTVVAAVSTSILIILIIVFIIFLLRRQSVSFTLLMDEVLCCCGHCLCCCPEGTCNRREDRTYLGQTAGSGGLARTYTFQGDSVTNGNRTFGHAVLERLRPKNKHRRELRTSNNAFAASPTSPLSLSPSSSLSSAFNNEEVSPLNPIVHTATGAVYSTGGCVRNGVKSGFDSDDTPFQPDNESDQCEVHVALVTTPVCIVGGRCKSRHRNNRKRRGYVTYSTCLEHSVRLTPVPELDTPVDESAGEGESMVLDADASDEEKEVEPAS